MIICQLLFIIPFALRLPRNMLLQTPFKLHLLRALVGICAMTTSFYVISHMLLAESTAISFTVPLFATLGAMLFLKEKVHLRARLAKNALWVRMKFGSLVTCGKCMSLYAVI